MGGDARMSKSKAEERRIPKCIETGKYGYRTRAGAARHQKAIERRDFRGGRGRKTMSGSPAAPYECEHCGLWHVGHRRKISRKHPR